MYIGQIKLANPLILAPMAGVTDMPFRILAKEKGCGLVYTEMVSTKGLIYNNSRTTEMLVIDQRERPVALQIFGSNPAECARAAQMVEAAGADIVDINMGCPTPKIIKNGEGSALLREPKLAYLIMKAVVEAVKIPVTVKIRKGWDEASVNAVEVAGMAEDAGISAIAVHGRTREQFYTGTADLSIIKRVKEKVSIPVIGNGDVKTVQDVKHMLDQTNCDAVMIGRGAQGNPWIFQQALIFLTQGIIAPGPDIEERKETMLRHLEMLIQLKGEYIGIREMRSHAAWYTKGLPHAAEIRMKFNNADSRVEFVEHINSLCRGFK